MEDVRSSKLFAGFVFTWQHLSLLAIGSLNISMCFSKSCLREDTLIG